VPNKYQKVPDFFGCVCAEDVVLILIFL